jgi:hypothetical protein
MVAGMQNSDALSMRPRPAASILESRKSSAADLARAGVDPAALDVGIRQIVELRVAGEVID